MIWKRPRSTRTWQQRQKKGAPSRRRSSTAASPELVNERRRFIHEAMVDRFGHRVTNRAKVRFKRHLRRTGDL